MSLCEHKNKYFYRNGNKHDCHVIKAHMVLIVLKLDQNAPCFSFMNRCVKTTGSPLHQINIPFFTTFLNFLDPHPNSQYSLLVEEIDSHHTRKKTEVTVHLFLVCFRKLTPTWDSQIYQMNTLKALVGVV